MMLFTDGSVNNKTRIGYGAYLLLSQTQDQADGSLVRLKRFEDTSSTRLELETLLWALNDVELKGCRIRIYTDSQSIVGLPARRERLEKNNYYSKNGKRLKNHELYQQFYKITDGMNCELIQVRGHMVAHQKDRIDQLFTLVDKASRKALRAGEE